MWKKRLEEEWNNNPLQTLAIGALAVTAAAKLIDAFASVRSKSAYARYSRRNRPL